jgi:DNA modification methylase
MVEASLRETGAGRSIVVDKDGRIIAGNKTLEAWADIAGADDVVIVPTDGTKLVVVQRQDLDLNDDTGMARKLAIYDNRAGEIGLEWDLEELSASMQNGLDLSPFWNDDEMKELFTGFDDALTGSADAEPQTDKAEELRQKWGVEPGQMWALGEHRIICGDCTDPATVARLMGGEKAVLCHADPPYGMGKEKDGIANDNLYREKLDAFQMAWWRAARPHIEDNGSAYIWGNAEDLWRLWYVGGLKDSERLTLRNEIVWDKGHGQGISSENFRSYAPATERCLFFMLGEQGFNNNADNYWEGWEPIRAYLEQERKRAGWDVPAMKRVVGHSDLSRDHWTGKSQWNFPPEDVYKKLQAAARGNAFKREYDDLKREFYATRAYFDNAHDNMTDVWDFPRVTGDDRHGHATPKPVTMIERAIKSSCSTGGVVYVPFGGTAPEIVACQNLNRKCRAVEISPAYCAVILQRMTDAFPGIDIERID